MKRPFLLLLMALSCQFAFGQRVEVLSPLQKLNDIAQVDVVYNNEFGKYRNNELDDPFPYVAIRVELEGDGADVREAKQRIGLDVGRMYRVEDSNKDIDNCILFLVRKGIKNVYLLCGDGCKKQLIYSDKGLEGNKVYVCRVRYYKEEVPSGPVAPVATLQQGCSVTIRATISDARIYVDGKDMGFSPYQGNLPFGTHTAYAMANGKKSDEQILRIQQGDRSLPTVELNFSSNQTITVGNVTFEMVCVEGGTFTMGATSEQGREAVYDEKPAHQVTLDDYCIGETEVTQALWREVMGSNPSRLKGDNLPVERVSWEDCQEFVSKLNARTGKRFRLPTEAEWEYAARGGSKSRGYKYSGSDNHGDVAWYDGNSSSQTHPVKTQHPNELGIYDMSGNVWEWCQDWYGKSYYSSSPQSNPTGPNSGTARVLRGGSWDDGARNCRVADRGCDTPGDRDGDLGFRLALSE